MRVLFATPRFPGDHHRGDQTRAYQQILHLSRSHAITLLSAEAPDPDSASHRRLAACCERIWIHPCGALRRGLGLLAAPLRGRPLQVGLYDRWPDPAALAGLLAASRFDLVHVQMARLAGLLEHIGSTPCVLDLVDALSLNMARRARLGRGPGAWLAGWEARTLRGLEQRLLVQAKAVVVSSAIDRDHLGAAVRIDLAGNGFDPLRFPFVPMQGRGHDVVFVGNLGYFPNVDAALWMIDAVMPALRRRRPATRLQLVGACPAPRLRRRAAAVDYVDLVGEVDDVHPFLARAGVAVSPLRAGSGQQLKLMEAMASGTPVVASPASARAVEAVDGVHLRIAEDADGMARALAELLDDRAAAATLAQSARGWVEQAHAWSHCAAALETAWLRAVDA